MNMFIKNKDIIYELSDFRRKNDLSWADIIAACIESMQLYGIDAYEREYWINDATYTVTIKENKNESK